MPAASPPDEGRPLTIGLLLDDGLDRPDGVQQYVPTTVTCTCGNTFVTRSTVTSGEIHADVCSACHPFYTGKQKILDTGGRVARFEARYGKKQA